MNLRHTSHARVALDCFVFPLGLEGLDVGAFMIRVDGGVGGGF